MQNVIEHYEAQSEDEEVAEDEAAFALPNRTMMAIPTQLVSAVRELIAQHQAN